MNPAADTNPEIAVVGGGPAGLLAAQLLAEAGHRVRVWEGQRRPGRKFLVAGHGGFNLTNDEPLPAFAARYGAQQARFAAWLAQFSPAHLRAWAHQLGIETYVGTSGRVFPLPRHKPAELLQAWLHRLAALGVTVQAQQRWQGFGPGGSLLFRDERTGHLTSHRPAATVLALGGASWPQTGSDGHWTTHLASQGVACVPFAPSNCGAEVAWSAYFREKVGRSPLKNVALRCGATTVRGEIMLTDYGLEGTPVYALSPDLRPALAGGPALLHLNLKPDLTPAQLLDKLARRRPGKSLASFLADGLHLRAPVPTLLRELVPALPTEAGALAALLQNLPLPVTGLRPLAEAISTAGGVAWSALTPNLMLHQCPGVFVAGEMLDWEAPTGGYLLQGCFSTGAAAARGVLGWLAGR